MELISLLVPEGGIVGGEDNVATQSEFLGVVAIGTRPFASHNPFS